MPALEHADLSILASLLLTGHSIRVTPHGRSMRPLLNGVSDRVDVEPLSGMPQENDLVFYRDQSGALAVHRVCCVHAESDCADMLGDGNLVTEYAIPLTDVYGRVSVIHRGDRDISVKDAGYRRYVRFWRKALPVRRYLLKAYELFCKRKGTK